jgi:hypothetical protein
MAALMPPCSGYAKWLFRFKRSDYDAVFAFPHEAVAARLLEIGFPFFRGFQVGEWPDEQTAGSAPSRRPTALPFKQVSAFLAPFAIVKTERTGITGGNLHPEAGWIGSLCFRFCGSFGASAAAILGAAGLIFLRSTGTAEGFCSLSGISIALTMEARSNAGVRDGWI